jgi:glycine betaine transporter
MPDGTPPRADRPVLWIALPAVAAVALWGLRSPEALRDAAFGATAWMLAELGWLLLLLATGCLVLVAWLGLGRHRGVRLGAEGELPQYSTFSWLAMLFAAGMGSGLVVWAVAEPITHYLSPPGGPLPPAEAARQAMVLTFLHWGLHAWAIYALCGLVVAWFAFRLNRPMLVSAPLEGLLPGRGGRWLAIGADSIGILAVAFGLAGTLVMGMLTLVAALERLGVGVGPALPFVALAVVGGISLASAISGIGRGIKLLSDFDVLMGIGLMAVVLLLGPTAFLLSVFVDSLGAYLAALPELSFRLRPFEAADRWTADWTLTYFLWWLAWGPFVGVFIARISRGRTLGEYVAGVVLVPTLGSMLWFAVIGGSGLAQVMADGADGALALAVKEEPMSALTLLLSGLPGGALLAWLPVVLLAVFIVTSVDAAVFVLGMMSEKGVADPTVTSRLLWGLALVGLAAAMYSVASIEAARAMAILGALPYPLILLVQTWALLKALRA